MLLFSSQDKIKRKSKEEEANFLQEISRFNSDFSLQGNKELLFESQTHTEIKGLERKAESLYKGHKRLKVNCMHSRMRLFSHQPQHLNNWRLKQITMAITRVQNSAGKPWILPKASTWLFYLRSKSDWANLGCCWSFAIHGVALL